MPAIAKTSDEAVVHAARKQLERGGIPGVSMQAVAEAVGVRAPSLYKRFPDRDALLDAVAEAVAEDLQAAIAAANRGASPRAALAAMARAYRAFARRSPHGYALLFVDRGRTAGPSVDARAAAAAPLLERLAGMVDPDHVLAAARLVTAWLHGFVAMEIAGAFRLGGDLEASFKFGLETLIRALERAQRT
ncbi:MAG TPA: TetR/AcrR family transcriptional regulator [Kofleriaceae bacterium]|nr:TetR/AcrR family transcriptional regulator [Kofleriaceae bacterium]